MRRTLVGLVVVGIVLAGATTAGAKVREPHPGPVRVLLVGDSLTASYQGRVAELLGPGYAVTGAGAGGQGMLYPDVCSGLNARIGVAYGDPDIVVIEYTGNYKPEFGTCTKVAPVYGSQKFYSQWKKSARKNQIAFRAQGARVVWTVVPATYALPTVPTLNALYRKLGKQDVVDLWTAFGGTYNSALHDPSALHFSPAGIEIAAQTVAAKVRG